MPNLPLGCRHSVEKDGIPTYSRLAMKAASGPASAPRSVMSLFELAHEPVHPKNGYGQDRYVMRFGVLEAVGVLSGRDGGGSASCVLRRARLKPGSRGWLTPILPISGHGRLALSRAVPGQHRQGMGS